MQALSIATSGLTAATARLDASAQRIARWSPTSEVDLGREAIEQVMAKTEFKANVTVIRTADQMMGELLDILA